MTLEEIAKEMRSIDFTMLSTRTQNDAISSFTTTVVAIPLTTNFRRSQLPSSVFVPSAGTGLPSDSVALCHQARVLDKTRLHGRIGTLPTDLLRQIEYAVLFTLGILQPPSSGRS